MRTIRLVVSLAAVGVGAEVLAICLSRVVLPLEEATRPVGEGTAHADVDFASGMLAYLTLLTAGTLNAAVMVILGLRATAVHRDAAAWRRSQRRVLQCCAAGAAICLVAAIVAVSGTTAIRPSSAVSALVQLGVYAGLAALVALCLRAQRRATARREE
ncbi:hypothetical protein LO762_12185 [Actinocorallia sp. API 0066]|uniref:hypothetical protein n=1 Tax=Actinocorallia sp. API 0066 TaxID=2896846 RepID=UPI001E4F2E06|nr:hypothetical protein [Actinocorallia sp. API 0066]MCD0449943.1 hypothetical protein [Actinocorallia sp. API 0066]